MPVKEKQLPGRISFDDLIPESPGRLDFNDLVPDPQDVNMPTYPPVFKPGPLPDVNAFLQARAMKDMSTENLRLQTDHSLHFFEKFGIPWFASEQYQNRLKDIETKQDRFFKNYSAMLGAAGMGRPSLEAIHPAQMIKEMAKGFARFIESGVFGTAATGVEWIGKFIELGGGAIDEFSRIGSKNPGQIYNPYAEAIITAGRGIAEYGRQSRENFSIYAMTGWEKLDKQLKETDPISYGAGRLTEGVASSALSVLAVYLSGGTSSIGLLDKGMKINKGLALLSTMSAAGGFEHAQAQHENFMWSTIHGLADGLIEYAMETNFLEGVGKGKSPLTAGFKESGEEGFTGMLQNTRAGMLENEKKGMSAYEGAKDAVKKSLQQAPWEVAAGFIGGFGMQGGANLVELTSRANQAPFEATEESIRQEKLARMLKDVKTEEELEQFIDEVRAELTQENPLEGDFEYLEDFVSDEKVRQAVEDQEVTPEKRETEIAQEPRTTPVAEESQPTAGVPQAQAEPEAGTTDFEAENAMLAEKRAAEEKARETANTYMTTDGLETGLTESQVKDTPQGQVSKESEKPVVIEKKAKYQDQLDQMDQVVKGTKPAYLADRNSFVTEEDYDAHIETMKQFAKDNDLVYGEMKDPLGDDTGIIAKDDDALGLVLDARNPQELRQALSQRDILGGVDPVQQLRQALRTAKELRPLKESEMKAERKKRVGAMMGTMKSFVKKGMKVEDAVWRSTAMLKGPLSDVRFEPVRGVIEDAQPGAVDDLFRSVYEDKNLKPFQIVETTDALRSLLDGEVITLRQMDILKKQFGIEDAILRPRVAKDALVDKLIALRNAGLLTGIKTSGLNTLSNLSHSLTEIGKDVPAAAVDSIASWFTGERTIVFTTKGTAIGANEGAQKAWEYLSTGVDERHAAEKYDWKRINFGTSKFAKGLQVYEQVIYRVMGGEDMPFYYMAKTRSIYNQAYAQAKTQKLKGNKRKAYIDKLVANPTDTMLVYAVHDAEVAVFQNRTMIGDIGRDIQRSRVGKLIVPFARTPAAVAMQVVNYSPVGAVKTVWDQVSKGEFDQRTFSQGVGRSTLGTGVIALGAHMFIQGIVSLDYPDSEKERKLWEIEGRKPNSVKVGDKWRDVQVLGPAGNLIMIGAYFRSSLDETGSPSQAMITALAGGAKTFSNQTFVTGINQTVEAITDPERSFERWFSSLAGSAVPTIVADIARATDTTERRTIGPVERIESRLPIIREGLEPKLDVFGQDMPRYGGNPLEVMIDPTRPFKIKEDVVVDELRRLWNKGIRVSPAMIGDRNGYSILTPEENTILWRRAGELTYHAIFNQMNLSIYKSLPDEGSGSKEKLLTDAIKTATDTARAEMAYIKNNQGVSIQEMFDSGLMNNDVHSKFLTTVITGVKSRSNP